MLRLLIVDDEPIIVRGLCELFEELAPEMSLDVYGSDSADEALDWMKRIRIDIIVTDIQMPGKNGIELQAIVRNNWPRCKVIFLTAYTDFAYAQSALRNGSVDYVLKTEGDRPLIQAVRRACEQIKLDMDHTSFFEQAKLQYRASLPILQKELLLNMFHGHKPAPPSADSLSELHMPVNLADRFYLVMGRVDQWNKPYSGPDRTLLLYAVNNIADELLRHKANLMRVQIEADRWLWLIQPKESAEQEYDENRISLAAFIHGNIESVQIHTKEMLNLPCSFIVQSTPITWCHAAETFDQLQRKMNLGLGADDEMLMIDVEQRRHGLPSSSFSLNAFRRKVTELETLLESGQHELFQSQLRSLLHSVTATRPHSQSTTYEIYYLLALMMISCCNRIGMCDDDLPSMDMELLFHMKGLSSWSKLEAMLLQFSQRFLRFKDKLRTKHTHVIVRSIHTYIQHHLSGDLSITHLSEIVHLNPNYLSRLFKQESGESITAYIFNLRMNRAKELLLLDPLIKIHDIAHAVGFESPSYFTRMFKRAAGLAPQEYRDTVLN
ncbi:response regulator [Paenibacillus sp. CF384]|uniref:response regulator n=1 Tax=Paenibacillus sp. CF384 TaxID=1884382 RepID=UPI000894364B|nr:helix-turn-helix domain-containing protein [Paenibacillus sp. CF384]SDX57989.1 two-component system, response regulator YesN [Paenibacillus sp. CF384]